MDVGGLYLHMVAPIQWQELAQFEIELKQQAKLAKYIFFTMAYIVLVASQYMQTIQYSSKREKYVFVFIRLWPNMCHHYYNRIYYIATCLPRMFNQHIVLKSNTLH